MEMSETWRDGDKSERRIAFLEFMGARFPTLVKGGRDLSASRGQSPLAFPPIRCKGMDEQKSELFTTSGPGSHLGGISHGAVQKGFVGIQITLRHCSCEPAFQGSGTGRPGDDAVARSREAPDFPAHGRRDKDREGIYGCPKGAGEFLQDDNGIEGQGGSVQTKPGCTAIQDLRNTRN